MINWQGLSSLIEREQRNNPQVLARCKYALAQAAEALQILSGHGYNQFNYGEPSNAPNDAPVCGSQERNPWEEVLVGNGAAAGLGELVPPSLKAEFAPKGQEVVAASADQSLQGSPEGVSQNG